MRVEDESLNRDTVDQVDAEQVESSIGSKQIGDRIRRLRTRQSMGLVDLGARTGLSASFLSQLETGRVVPTIRNLARIALAFNRDLSYFFREENPVTFRVLRRSERVRLLRNTAADGTFCSESLSALIGDGSMVPCIAEFRSGEEEVVFHPKTFDGTEFTLVTEGTIVLQSESEHRTLEQGDVVWLDATRKRTYCCPAGLEAKAIIITRQARP